MVYNREKIYHLCYSLKAILHKSEGVFEALPMVISDTKEH